MVAMKLASLGRVVASLALGASLSIVLCRPSEAETRPHLPNAVRAFHELALGTKSTTGKDLTLPFPAYVVAIEKADANQVGTVRECTTATPSPSEHCLNVLAPYFQNRRDLLALLQQKYSHQYRPTFVSHIAKFAGADAPADPCFLYNIYVRQRLCPGVAAVTPPRGEYVDRSWVALAQLGEDMSARVASERPSHLIVYVMGWNTPQWQALKNYRDLQRQLMAAASGKSAFRPLFVGITWPSTGNPRIPGSDYGIKADDADEVGAIWINVLLNRLVPTARQMGPVRVVVIGHSFGARASSRAVFSAPLVADGWPQSVDLLIGLESAYSFQRYVRNAGIEGAPYVDYQTAVGKVALTTSKADTAVTSAGHERYFAGSDAVFKITQMDAYKSEFEHATARDDGTFDSHGCDHSTVLMIDSSRIIKTGKAASLAGAHSDIYNPQVGRLIFELIERCAPPSPIPGE